MGILTIFSVHRYFYVSLCSWIKENVAFSLGIYFSISYFMFFFLSFFFQYVAPGLILSLSLTLPVVLELQTSAAVWLLSKTWLVSSPYRGVTLDSLSSYTPGARPKSLDSIATPIGGLFQVPFVAYGILEEEQEQDTPCRSLIKMFYVTVDVQPRWLL